MKLLNVLFQLALTGYLFYNLITDPSTLSWCIFVVAVVCDIAMLYRGLKSS